MSFKKGDHTSTMDALCRARPLAPPLGLVATQELIGCMLSSPFRSTHVGSGFLSATATKIRCAAPCSGGGRAIIITAAVT